MYLSATGMSAFVRFVAGVCTDVLLQMRQLCKLALTNFTLVRFYSQMYPGMLREVTRIGKGFVALGTLVRLGLPHVDLSVQLQICLRTENLSNLWTHFTLVFPS